MKENRYPKYNFQLVFEYFVNPFLTVNSLVKVLWIRTKFVKEYFRHV